MLNSEQTGEFVFMWLLFLGLTLNKPRIWVTIIKDNCIFFSVLIFFKGSLDYLSHFSLSRIHNSRLQVIDL